MSQYKNACAIVTERNCESIILNNPDLNLDDDFKFMSIVVKKNGGLLRLASPRLRNSIRLAIHSLRNQEGSGGYEHLSDSLKGNRSIAILAMQVPGAYCALQHAPESIKMDPEIVTHSVETYGISLEFAHNSLRDNEGICRIAVKDWAGAIQFCSPRVRDINDVYLLTFESEVSWDDPMDHPLRYASARIQNDRELVIKTITDNCYSAAAIVHASEQMRDDVEVGLAITLYDISNIQFLSERLRNDREFMFRLALLRNFDITELPEQFHQDPVILGILEEKAKNKRRRIV